MRERWTRWSLRRRVVVASAIAVVTLAIVATAVFSWALDRILTQTATDAARLQATQLATMLSSGEYSPRSAVDALPPAGSVVQIVDPAGIVLASSEPTLTTSIAAESLPPPGSDTVHHTFGIGHENDPYVVVTRTVPTAQGTDAVAVAVPLAVETRTVATATSLLATGAVLLGALMLFSVGRIVRGALAPVERISSEVSRIGRAGGGERVSVPPARDEIADLAETMNAMLERIDRADATTHRFVSDASHELRSPLATLRSHLETATTPEAIDAALVHREVLRLQRLVDDLLTLAKVDDAGLVLDREEVDLDDVVDTEVRRLRTMAPDGVRSHIEPAQVLGDANRLTQVLRNLTENALRHADREVAVTMEPSTGVVLVHVDNDGEPIPPDQREAVFDRFVRLDDARARDRGGSGLGLAIARAFTQAHGGRLTTTASPSGGCRFTLELPILPQPSVEAEGSEVTERSR